MASNLQSILEAESLTEHLSKFTDQGVTDAILGELTDSDLKELGIEKLGERKRLLMAFGCIGKKESLTVEIHTASPAFANSPAEATKETPFINSLGMPFVPIPRFETRFCIWPVRVQDYEQYCAATGAAYPLCPFPQGSDHPVVGVTWSDSMAFCKWLTDKERKEGKIDKKTSYRLPKDMEWSSAVGLPHEPEPTPEKRHLKAPGYPWGLRWPPPQNTGNYEHYRVDQQGLIRLVDNETGGRGDIADEGVIEELKRIAIEWKREWRPVDEFEFTSSVGSFPENPFGIHDLGGNVWEFCMDNYGVDCIVVRGGSFASAVPGFVQEDALEMKRTGLNSVGNRIHVMNFTSKSYGRKPWTNICFSQGIDPCILYRSSYRGRVDKNNPLIAFGEGGDYRTPCGGFRVVLSKI